MPDRRTIDDRLSALERRLEGPQGAGPDPSSTASARAGSAESAATTDLEARVETLEAELAELEAGVQALRGYVGNVEHVNESVERRANAAIAAVERLESAPKTPPPIATATSESEASEEPVATREPATEAAEQPDSDTETEGILDRLRALR